MYIASSSHTQNFSMVLFFENNIYIQKKKYDFSMEIEMLKTEAHTCFTDLQKFKNWDGIREEKTILADNKNDIIYI